LLKTPYHFLKKVNSNKQTKKYPTFVSQDIFDVKCLFKIFRVYFIRQGLSKYEKRDVIPCLTTCRYFFKE